MSVIGMKVEDALNRKPKPKITITELAAKKSRCREAKAAGLPCTEFSKKLALVTINIGNVLHQKSRESFKAAAARWGAEYIEITLPIKATGGKPHWQKAFLADHLINFDRCVYYDADILIRDDCPSVFDMTPQGYLGIVTNDQIDGNIWKPAPGNRYWSSLQEWSKRLGIPFTNLHEHCNSGMIVFEPKIHSDLFTKWSEAGKSCNYGAPTKLIDQACFSVLITQVKNKTWLPMQFNTLIYRHELIKAAGYMQTFVYHYTGHRKDKLNETDWQRKPVISDNVITGCQIENLVDKAYVINLDRRQDRLERFTKGLPKPWLLPEVIRQKAIDVNLAPPPDWFRHEVGQWGCRQSHLRILEDSLNEGIDSVLIFEDDAEFCPDFNNRLKAFLTELPTDWELVFLGGNHTRPIVKKLSKNVVVPSYVTLAHAYMVKDIKNLYRYINKHTPNRAEIDHRIGEYCNSGTKVYAPSEWLVYQSAGFSDLRQKVRPRRGT